jgi:hypothetical protein
VAPAEELQIDGHYHSKRTWNTSYSSTQKEQPAVVPMNPALLALLDLAALPVVGGGEAGEGLAVGPSAMHRSLPLRKSARIRGGSRLIAVRLRRVHLAIVEGEQEGPPLLVVHVVASTGWLPRVVAVVAESPPELSPHDGQRVLHVVAGLWKAFALKPFSEARNILSNFAGRPKLSRRNCRRFLPPLSAALRMRESRAKDSPPIANDGSRLCLKLDYSSCLFFDYLLVALQPCFLAAF